MRKKPLFENIEEFDRALDRAMESEIAFEEFDRAFTAAMKEVVKTQYPNPERRGCPPVETIVALAEKTLHLDDPAIGHVGECSPCFNELWEIKGASDLDAPAMSGCERTTGLRTTLSRDARDTVRKEANRLRLALRRIQAGTVAVFEAATDESTDFALLDFAYILEEAEALIRRQSEAFLKDG